MRLLVVSIGSTDEATIDCVKSSAAVPAATTISVVVVFPNSPALFSEPRRVGVEFKDVFLLIALPLSTCRTSEESIPASTPVGASGFVSGATTDSVTVTSPSSFPSLLFCVRLFGPVATMFVLLLFAESIGSIVDETTV